MRLKIRKDWAEIAYVNKKESVYYLKAIERVRELHKPFGDKLQWCDHCEIGQNSGYEWADYPCPTIQALDGDV